ncbi:MAG TPA: adenosylcobinamide-GDP ribazoletransferase [Paracoccaceae bacterium]|nr:adenosylcobinamide-GDP ribazoletransferase [Paracoccaceae bacterium]
MTSPKATPVTHRPPIAPPLSDLAEALALLTRLPVPGFVPRGARSAWAWPLAGAIVGTLAGGAGALALWAGMPAGVAAAVAVATAALATGGLHEDGLADSFDGLFGGRTPAARLAIMRDSRLGSFGALALVLAVLIRWTALAALAAAGPGSLLAGAVAAAALSRAPMAAVSCALPNARGGGLSHATGRPAARTAVLAALAALVLALALWGLPALWLALAATLPALWLAAQARRRIGGQTGDVLGGCQVLAECATLAVAAAILG